MKWMTGLAALLSLLVAVPAMGAAPIVVIDEDFDTDDSVGGEALVGLSSDLQAVVVSP